MYLKAFTVGYKLCTMHLITYPDVVYKVATDAILIQTRCVQSVVSLEMLIPGLYIPELPSFCDEINGIYPFFTRNVQLSICGV